ncbi:MAG: hypothetical protein H6Q72_4712 [Firmicutes bacterium]|nr:hypothetical protein [Bacillota bacterium]
MDNILTPEDIEFLRELGRELKTQDNAATATPIYFTIMQEDITTGIDEEYADGMCVCDCEGNIFIETDDFKKFLIENYADSFDAEELEDMEIWELFGLAERCGVDDLTYTGYRNIEKHDGVFLTRKALDDHVKANYYHYKKNPVSYAHHAWRNPEMKRLLEIVEKFVEG